MEKTNEKKDWSNDKGLAIIILLIGVASYFIIPELMNSGKSKKYESCMCIAAWHNALYKNQTTSFYYGCKDYWGDYDSAKADCDKK